MRYILLLVLLVCVACGSGPPGAATIERFNGMWTDEVGGATLFDLNQKRATILKSMTEYTLTRVDGDTIYLNGSNGDKVTVRLIGGVVAEWRTETTGPFYLTKVAAP